MKKILSLFIVFTLLLSCFALPVMAGEEQTRESQASIWDGTIYTLEDNGGVSFTFEGEGTATEPYLIKSADDLAKLAANVNAGTNYKGKYIKLTCDINIDDNEWKGIGFGSNADSVRFEGNFNGDNHLIYNFALLDSAYNGLFGYVGNGAVIRNIGIASGHIELTNTRSGPLIGFAKLNLTVENCFNKADITMDSQGWIGGLIGTVMNNAAASRRFVSCYADCTITVNSPLTDKQNQMITDPNYCVGGLIGVLYEGDNTFQNCYSLCDINVNALNTGFRNNEVQNYAVAGLIGCHAWAGNYTYTNCGFGGTINYENPIADEITESVVALGNMVGFVRNGSGLNMDETCTYVDSVGKDVGTSAFVTSAKEVEEVTIEPDEAGFLGMPSIGGGESGDETDTPEGGESTYVPADDADRARYEAASKWDGTVYHVDAIENIYTFEGKGTKAEPYLLQSAEDVAKLAANVRLSDETTNYLGEYFKLTCDLDLLNYEWWGIGGCQVGTGWDDNRMFAGIFDGDNHVIYNLNLEDKADGATLCLQGFFGYVGYGEVHNLGIMNGDVELNGSTRSATLIGVARYELVVSNCFNRANITFHKGTDMRVGGLIGAVMNLGSSYRTIENCYNAGDVTVNMMDNGAIHTVGGIVGYISDGARNRFKNCYNTGDITVNSNHGTIAPANLNMVGIGSLVGSIPFVGTFSFDNCGAGGSVTFNNKNESGNACVGAMIGFVRSGTVLAVNDGNTHSTEVENIIGVYDLAQPDNVAKVDTVSVPMADNCFFIENIHATPDNDPPQGGDQTPGGDTQDPTPSVTDPVVTTPTTTPATTPADGGEEAGCASTVGGAGILALLALLSPAALVLTKKKND